MTAEENICACPICQMRRLLEESLGSRPFVLFLQTEIDIETYDRLLTPAVVEAPTHREHGFIEL